ncbi:MAG: hypothetical protein OXU23_18025 [Candidatus Poribacteria bacterium]|nr:hypothetical protein [Candidatus Poribacteria bacterium]
MTDEQKNSSCLKTLGTVFVVIMIGVGIIVSLYDWYLERQCKPYFYGVNQIITVPALDLNLIGYSRLYDEVTSITEKKEHCDKPIYIRFKDPVSVRGLESDIPFRLFFKIKIIKLNGPYSYVGSVQNVIIKE